MKKRTKKLLLVFFKALRAAAGIEKVHAVDYGDVAAILGGMETASVALPADLLAEVEAAAEQEHRAPSDVVRDAVEGYLRQTRQNATAAQSGPAPTLTAAEAVARILEQRAGNVLPEGVTIKELMTYGRA